MKKLRVLGQEIPLKISHSSLEVFQCPLRVKLVHVDRVKDRQVHVAAEKGSAVHAAIEDLISLCLERKIQPRELSIDEVSRSVEKNLPAHIASEAGEVLSWTKLWAERYQISKHIYGHEEKLAIDDEFEEIEWDKASYRGILDVVDVDRDHLTVTDWKSQAHILNQSELDNHDQLTMYCWLASKIYPDIKTFTARIWYLRYGFAAETRRTREDLDAFERALMIQERKILDMVDFDPSPGKHCGYCDVKAHCPLAKDTSEVPPNIVTQEQAVEVAKKITASEAMVKELKARLKDYVKSNDAIHLGDGWVWGFQAKSSKTYNMDEVIEALLEHGHQLAEVASLDARKLKKLVKTNPQIEPALAAIEKVKVRTEFRGYKQGDDDDEDGVD